VKAKDLRQKSVQELKELLAKLREELRVLNTLYINKRPFNYGRRRQIKRDIARILTVLRERNEA